MKREVIAGLMLIVASCSGEPPARETAPVGIDGARITDGAPGEWLTVAGGYEEQRFSRLSAINRENVEGLGLAWFADLDTARGQEATPLFIDGVLYTTTAWSKVKAYDVSTAELLWSYDPLVPGETAVKACCDVVNRGLAAWGGQLYFGTLDGRLIALDRASGQEVWSVVTVDQSKPYTITGAPRIVKGKVLIGNGGAEFGVRGYLSAHDASTGELLWRFYTVPDNPANGKQPAYLEAAVPTWSGEWWRLGGGGTVWDSMAYDDELDLLYIGTGNGSPWNQAIRSPEGGDNLYLSSIVAIRPDTGEYVWHYQETPGETWDYTATQHIILADLTIDGRPRQVLMHAPKNGFFYVLDRRTGELISAKNYVSVNWATGIDEETGRPIEAPEARYGRTGVPFIAMPGPGGAHSWHPMAFDPDERLVYIPANIAGFPYFADTEFEPAGLGFNTGVDFHAGATPPDRAVRQSIADSTAGALIAWDPVKQEARWRVDYPGPNNGGLLATAGGLVFQGSAGGEFAAFDSGSGEVLWSMPVQTGVIAAPVTYQWEGEQYVAVLAGWGGVFAISPPSMVSRASGAVPNVSRLLVFKLGGEAQLPDTDGFSERPLDPPALRASAETLDLGARRYARFCGVCHGDAALAGTLLPDLRRSGALESRDAWMAIVRDGALTSRGMVGFSSVMSEDEIEAVRQYAIARANQDKALGEAQ
jgi:alcohol dehydrogenase (cytochrome c)/quinohemoprotein ethanol dehydrogenase